MLGANFTITNASILLLFTAILSYSPYLTIAAGFLGITAIFFSQKTTQASSVYKTLGILFVIVCVGLLNLRIEINYQYLLFIATIFLLIFISKTEFTDSINIFFLALFLSFVYRFDDFSQLFIVWQTFGDNATSVLTNSQFSSSGIFSLNRLALAIVFMVVMTALFKTSIYLKVVIFAAAFFIAGLINSRALYVALFLSILFLISNLFKNNEKRNSFIIFLVFIFTMFAFYIIVETFSSGVRSSTLNLSLSCINSTIEFFVGDPICAKNVVQRDFDSIYLVLFAFYGFFGAMLFFIGILFFCFGCKIRYLLDFIFILIIFLIVHSLDVSYTNPEFFIPFIIAQFLSNNSYKENEV